MASVNTSLNLVELDVDKIKGSLKTYLKSQQQFLDYDFDGSAMSTLLDVLALNTFHNSFYLNMVASEAFLDSAQLRNSIVSHAKELNYVPRSARSAKATVSITFDSNTQIVTIPKNTSFTTSVGTNLYTFLTNEEVVKFSSNGHFVVEDLDIYEGKSATDTFIVNYNNPTQRFIVTDPNVDTRSITVQVIEDNAGTVNYFTPSSTTLGLDEDSKVYFLQGAEDGKYEILFGDGIIGRKPKDSAIIRVDYRTCSGPDSNGASKFSLDYAFADFSTSPSVFIEDVARGGDWPESNESIKFYAPRNFQTQERAVNTNDYEIILKQRFPEINAISAYGGEDLLPPQYGKVFISIDISEVDGLPSSKVDEYYNFLKPRSPLSIDPVFIVPEYLYYAVSTTVKYDVNQTSLNPEQIKSLVANRIISYNDVELDDFKSSFRYSKFVRQIDDIEDAGIVSNDTSIKPYKKFTPTIGVNTNVNLNFALELTKEGSVLGVQYDSQDLVAVRSSNFVFNGDTVHVDDDGDGTMRLVKTVGDSCVVVYDNIGTVDYETGFVQLTNFRVDALPLGESQIRFYSVTASKDFSTKENVILSLESSQMTIDVVQVRYPSGSSQTRQRG